MTKKRLFAALALLWCVTSAQAASLEQQRALFQQTYTELQAGNTAHFAALPAEMKQYPLYPWLEYAYLKQTFADRPDAQVVAFILRNPESLMADDLYTLLAERMGKNGDWQKLLVALPADDSASSAQCYRAQALAATGQKDQALELGKQAWMGIEKTIPAACVPVLSLLRSHVRLSTDDYWERIQAAIDKSQTALANQLAADLPPDQQALVTLWGEIRNGPAENLPTTLKLPDSPYVRKVIVDGLARLGKKQPDAAQLLWSSAQQKFKFTPAESGQVESTLGMYQALHQDPAAVARLAAIPTEFRTQDGSLWLARSAARQADWANVLKAVEGLKFDQPRDAVAWKYWKARALEQTGQKEAANTLYTEVASVASYYGFLAADHLGQDYRSLQTTPVDRHIRVAGLQRVAAIQRTWEWIALGDRAQGRKEWFRALKQMDTDGVLAAADLATRAGDPNLAIWTVARAKAWDEVDLRFPLVHTDLVQVQARNQGIQPAWILGVIRRESAFDANVESSANALGLMQLIPPTARDVGRRLGLSINGKEDILQPATNIQLGSAYLRELLGKFSGNYEQATAAYNAGPGRPAQWAPSAPLNADQWIESIPFTETRDYVQAVMGYTTVYDYKLNNGNGLRLSERLPPITPNQADAPTSTVPTAHP